MASKSKCSVWKYFKVSKKDLFYLTFMQNICSQWWEMSKHTQQNLYYLKKSLKEKNFLIESSAASTFSDYEKTFIITRES